MATTKHYYIVIANGVITKIGYLSKLRDGMTEITKAEYDNYKAIIAAIPSKAGYIKKVTLYVDGTYDVEYIEMVIEDNEE